MEQDQEKTPVTEKTVEKEETPASAQKVAGLQSNSDTPVSNEPINTNEVASAAGNTDDKSKKASKESQGGKVTANNGEVVSKETTSNSESRKLRSNAVPLWEKLNSACHDIEVDEHSNYYWPEERSYTNNIIRQLKEKRILFIRSFTENWSFRALQRLATVMHAENEGSNLIIRINTGEDLDFGFWINERPLPYPVVIIMPVHRYDFFQKFTQNAQYVMNTQLPELRRLNLHIVCQIQTTTALHERFPAGDHWMKQTYAFWDIPVVKLELTSKFGVRGQATFEQIQDKIEKYGEHPVGWELVKRSYTNPEDVIEQLDKHIEESAQEIRQRKEALINILDGTDFIHKLLVFCASFFSGLHYRDFAELVTQLLKYEQANQQYTTTDQVVTAEPKLTLGQLWEKNADQYLTACSIKTVWKDGNHRVEFAFRGLADIMSTYITNERYPFFYRVYRNFENAKLITNLNLSKDLEKSLINLFAKAARMDTQNYSAEWLKNEVCTLWEEYSKEMPEQIDSYEDLFSYLYDKKFFGEMLLKRVPLIINGLLTENDADYSEIIKEFFRLLLTEPHARRIAIIIASDLYKKFKGTDTFSTDDLMDYFRKTLEGNNSWDDRFFAYDALRDCMEAEAMRQQSDFWKSGETETSESLIMQFTCLYQLDYVLESFQRYFGIHKGTGTYELWDKMDGDEFPQSFVALVAQLLSENSLKNLGLIMENRYNREQFENRVLLLEGLETEEILLVSARFYEPNNTAISLLADAFETWFYLLTKNAEADLQPEMPFTPVWAAYVRLLTKSSQLKTLRKIRSFWQVKTGYYTLVIQDISNRITKKDNKLSAYLQSLKKRRTSLRMLLRHLQSDPVFQLPPTDFKTLNQ